MAGCSFQVYLHMLAVYSRRRRSPRRVPVKRVWSWMLRRGHGHSTWQRDRPICHGLLCSERSAERRLRIGAVSRSCAWLEAARPPRSVCPSVPPRSPASPALGMGAPPHLLPTAAVCWSESRGCRKSIKRELCTLQTVMGLEA